MDARQLWLDCEAALGQGLALLPDKPEETGQTTLAALWLAAAGAPLSASRAGLVELPPLDERGAQRLRELVGRRVAGTPLAYLTGRQSFMGVEMLASPGALIPRRETELLATAALERLREVLAERGAALVLDACTGSGNVALALAWHEPRSQVRGADLSEEAVAVARRNAAHLGLEARVQFHAGDLLQPFESGDYLGAVDVVTCNPPYISSGKLETMPGEIIGHEPRLAFDGGPLGIRILNRLMNEAPRWLRNGGWLVFEVGLGQGRGVRKRLEQHGAWTDVREATDEAGQVRVLMARHRAAAPGR